LINNLYLLKGHTAQKLQKGIPNKTWNEHSVWKLLKTKIKHKT